MIPINDFTTEADKMVQLLTRLVNIESPTTEKLAVDRLGTYIKEELGTLGATLEIDPQSIVGDHIIGRWNPSSNGSGILALFHMDTVFESGTVSKQPIRVENGKFHGPGALDMKASIAIFLTAVGWMQKQGLFPTIPITALFTSDEETGSYHSRTLIEHLAAQSTLTLCMEPALPDGSLKTARKGTGDIEIVTRGIAAHAGADHEKGRNAIEELAHHILAVQKLTDYARGTTVNVGLVSGGTRSNVVPDYAHAKVDFRITVNEEAERIRQWASHRKPVLDGTQVAITVKQDRPPMPRNRLMVETFQKVQAIAKQIGLELSEGSTGGGSDANLVAPLGLPVIDGLGAIGNGAHSEREYVLIKSMAERAALLTAILINYYT